MPSLKSRGFSLPHGGDGRGVIRRRIRRKDSAATVLPIKQRVGAVAHQRRRRLSACRSRVAAERSTSTTRGRSDRTAAGPATEPSAVCSPGWHACSRPAERGDDGGVHALTPDRFGDLARALGDALARGLATAPRGWRRARLIRRAASCKPDPAAPPRRPARLRSGRRFPRRGPRRASSASTGREIGGRERVAASEPRSAGRSRRRPFHAAVIAALRTVLALGRSIVASRCVVAADRVEKAAQRLALASLRRDGALRAAKETADRCS